MSIDRLLETSLPRRTVLAGMAAVITLASRARPRPKPPPPTTRTGIAFRIGSSAVGGTHLLGGAT